MPTLGVSKGVFGSEEEAFDEAGCLSECLRQSKSEHVPTRRQMKQKRVWQLSWYTMLQPPACSTMTPQWGQGRMRGPFAKRRRVPMARTSSVRCSIRSSISCSALRRSRSSTSQQRWPCVQGAPQTLRPHTRVPHVEQAVGRPGPIADAAEVELLLPATAAVPPSSSSTAGATPGQSVLTHAMPPVRCTLSINTPFPASDITSAHFSW
mmetsp:Transcript_82020/g.265767  ORF Transcript_82020/g.265767 Transcript_82020/m.265767 type:complete len:208 (+) Transcript_82020:272-895(+)